MTWRMEKSEGSPAPERTEASLRRGPVGGCTAVAGLKRRHEEVVWIPAADRDDMQARPLHRLNQRIEVLRAQLQARRPAVLNAHLQRDPLDADELAQFDG